MNIENVYAWGSENKSQVERLVIMLHGVGSNGQDLMSLAPYLAEGLPNTLFLSPDAPFPCDMVPEGYPNSFQWFSLQDRDPDVMLLGVESVFPILEKFIDEKLAEFEVAPEKLVLMGFSQGTMTALYAAPRLKHRIGGVLGYSGALLNDGSSVESGLHDIPLRLIHGEADDVVPVEAWHQAKEMLDAAGFTNVTGQTQAGLGHSLDQDGVDSGGEFLMRVFMP